MRTAVIVSFDLIRPGEPATSLALGSLLAALAHEVATGAELDVHHVSVNLLDMQGEAAVEKAEAAVLGLGLSARDAVAVSGYVWSEPLTTRLIERLRAGGFGGTIILGGYQVSYAREEELPALYPGVDLFISGYAEKALCAALTKLERPSQPRVLAEQVDFTALPSPYLGNAITVEEGQGMVRLESKRGCPFRCAFCAHRDLRGNRVHARAADRVRLELDFLAAQRVGKI
ncbi:MAG TPA: hypothetical protein VF541_20265, partial [Longimicrobium sp.]